MSARKAPAPANPAPQCVQRLNAGNYLSCSNSGNGSESGGGGVGREFDATEVSIPIGSDEKSVFGHSGKPLFEERLQRNRRRSKVGPLCTSATGRIGAVRPELHHALAFSLVRRTSDPAAIRTLKAPYFTTSANALKEATRCRICSRAILHAPDPCEPTAE